MTLSVKYTTANGAAEVVGDSEDPGYEVVLPAGKLADLRYNRSLVDAWLGNHEGDPPIDAAQEQRDRSNVEGEGKIEPH